MRAFGRIGGGLAGNASQRVSTLRGKLAVAFALVIGTISASIFIYFPNKLEEQALGAVQAEGQALADMSAFNVRAAVFLELLGEINAALDGALAAQDVVHAVVLDRSGNELASHHAPGSPLLDLDAANLDPGVSPDRRAFTAVAPIVFESEELGRVRLTLSLDRVRGEVRKLRGAVGLVSLLIFALGMLTILFAASWIMRPLLEIVRVAEGITRGEFFHRAEIKSTDEVGALAESFNLMVDRLTSTQERLEHANTELEQALDNLPGQVGVFDLEHRVLYLNPNAQSNAESRRAAKGMTLEEYSPDGFGDRDFKAAFIRLLDRCISLNEVVSEELSVKRSDGEERHYIGLFSPIRGSDGRPAKVIAYGLDITERRNAEDALAESEERYRQAQKMEAVGRLAGGVAHDFNNLLTAIYGHTEMVQEELGESHRASEDLYQVKIATERATRLTKQLLAFSRQQVLQPTVLDMNEVVQEMEKMITRLIGEHIQVTTRFAPEPIHVHADRGQVDQVILNLVVNAGDAMPDGGSLTIETSLLELGPGGCGDPECSLLPGPHAVLTVTDTGSGMDQETQNRMFEPFFTTKGVTKGTGLGLATVYGIVEQSEGCIQVESEVGVGTTFRILLPLTTERATDRRERRKLEAPSGGGETILLVEDESLVRTLLVQLLRQDGFRVLPAQDPEEALDIAQSHRGDIDLLLTDVVMPQMNGPLLAARIKGWRPDVRVALMSGYPDKEGPAEGHLDPSLPLLQKPFKREKLHSFVRQVLAAPIQEAG